MSGRVAIGLDVGTSSVKGTVLTESGTVRTARSRPYPTSAPAAGLAEQDPDDWWAAVGEVLSLLVEQEPRAGSGGTVIGLTGQMHTSVLRDDRQRLLRPAILWSDQRAAADARRVEEAVPGLADITGNRLLPAFTLAHLAWLRREAPDVLARAASVSVPKDDVRRRLGAGWSTEPSDASATAMLDTRTDRWSPQLLRAVGLTPDVLPDVRPSHEVTGVVTTLPPAAAGRTGLLGVPVVGGAGDQAAQAVALGVDDPGSVGISIGTSGVAFSSLATPRPGSFRHAYPARWLALDSVHAAGLALSWWAGVVGADVPDVAAAARPSDGAPVFLPHLQGHRGGAGAPGAFVELDATHDAHDLAFAVLEGVAVELAGLVAGLGAGAVPPAGEVRLGGGGGASALWRQTLADALERDVVRVDRDSSHGAALIAARTAGWGEAAAAAGGTAATRDRPDPAGVARTRRRRSRRDAVAAALTAGPLG